MRSLLPSSTSPHRIDRGGEVDDGRSEHIGPGSVGQHDGNGSPTTAQLFHHGCTGWVRGVVRCDEHGGSLARDPSGDVLGVGRPAHGGGAKGMAEHRDRGAEPFRGGVEDQDGTGTGAHALEQEQHPCQRTGSGCAGVVLTEAEVATPPRVRTPGADGRRGHAGRW